jgi:hypothetical protein
MIFEILNELLCISESLFASDTGISFVSSLESSSQFEFIVGLPLVWFHFMDVSLDNL